ncbi:MAG: hypothetical protein COU85_01280 [Candidatus Portnoybacteria bacterium CG10_big_fil_rev_8_21_14_0_10_44_7]|uniref:Uncharacterized protein n=1 Tax=Candidatus Portnoybacteria bacterium CG10_big_fil_rev_8_21_14_0_10_44_7 TaxID=1974816 RepID=A0A2M8KJ11_9BACT|nr:MAG: hypothetical protein COU85_01280 [Candidatus Portnoybacteria bacterium CG10_big_fil_rev_8_21_14_0_10_44_7]
MEKRTNQQLKGLIRCTKYAFMPNRLHFCGPENQADILEFYAQTTANKAPKTIKPLLEKFETMYPYLKLIARANNVKNPLDEKIVEAYWLGNEQLGNISLSALYYHLTDALKIDKKLGMKKFNKFKEALDKKALPHHNFHVFSVWRRTGSTQDWHTLASIDACRISWGVISQTEKEILVKTRPLNMDERGQIFEGQTIEKKAIYQTEGQTLVKNLKIGDLVSLHWGAICEKINTRQGQVLQKITDLCLSLINTEIIAGA